MTHRYALRFEEGDRRGEIVALTGATTTFGRKPGNSVQLLDASVSGKHAEMVLEESGVLLRDLGSTNGTRVNGERISEKRLKGGDRVMLGTVDLTFVDGASAAAKPQSNPGDIGLELEADEPAPSRAGRAPSSIEMTSVVNALQVPTGDAGEAVRSIGAEKLARAGKKPALALIGLLVLGAGAGAAWWFTRAKSGDGPSISTRAVSPVAGNLLANGYSFEASDLPAGWTNAPGTTASFDTDRSARASGLQGLSAELGSTSSALLISEAVAAGRPLTLSCELAARGGVEVRTGLRFESSTNAQLPVEAWRAWSPASEESGLQRVELRAAAPACYDRVRALIAARAASEGGTALVDDVALVVSGEAELRGVKHDDVELVVLGEPASTAVLFKIDHSLLSRIQFKDASDSGLALESEADPLGMRLRSKSPAAKLEFAAEASTAAGGVASTGRDGFKTHQAQFERADVDSVLIGAGRELVRLRFEPAVLVRGRPEAGENGTSFSLEAVGASSALIQVTFNEERVAAEALVRDARAAQTGNRPAEEIQAWSRLINEHPIDALLVQEAESGRAKALSKGLEAVAAVRADVERARFFRLIELFRECRAKSLATAEAYAGSEVEASARALAASVDKDIELLARDLDKLEAQRLAQIHSALKATKQTRIAERVAAELKSRFQVDPDAPKAAPNAGENP